MNKVISLILLISLISCSYKPILGDNYKFQTTNEDQRESDIKSCEKKADEHLKGVKARRVGKEAVRKGAIWSIVGGVFSFFVGGNSSSLIRGAAVGAGAGAAVGGGSVLAEGKLTPDQIKQRYVVNCLSEKGYSVIGWE